MIESLGRRLRVAFDRPPVADDDAPLPPVRLPGPELDFVAYGVDGVLSGRVRLEAERLSDMLNAHDEVQLVDVMVERLDDAHAVEVREVIVPRSELLLVHATGPRGSQDRRTRMRQHAIALRTGPYHVRGYIHARPGFDPLLALHRRPTMVPLTDATIDYVAGGVHQRRRVSGLVVNRDQLEWAVPTAEVDLDTVEFPVVVQSGPLVKDFTGSIRYQPTDPTR